MTNLSYNRRIHVLHGREDSIMETFKSPILQQSSIMHGFPNVFTTYQPNIPVMQETTQTKVEGSFSEQVNQRLDEITRQIQNMQENFNQTRDAQRRRRVIVCYTCGVEGHISTRCPSRRQGDWGQGMDPFQSNQNNTSNNFHQLNNHIGGESTLVQIPTSPPKVNLLDFVYDIVEDCDVACNKTTTASHKNKELEGEASNSQQKKKSKETNLEDGPRKKYPQRKIKIDDMLMGKGMEPFDLKQKLISGGPHIPWPQLLQLSPSLKKEWGRVSSIQQSIKTS